MAKRYQPDGAIGILRPGDFLSDRAVLDESECDVERVRQSRVREAEKRLALMPRLASGKAILPDGQIARLTVNKDGDFLCRLRGKRPLKLDFETLRPQRRTRKVVH